MAWSQFGSTLSDHPTRSVTLYFAEMICPFTSSLKARVMEVWRLENQDNLYKRPRQTQL